MNPEKAREVLPASLSRFDVAPNGCWIFQSRGPSGYASNTSYRGRKANAYKLIWEVLNQQRVPKGMVLDHYVCDNGQGGCVNPNHLRVCTQRENVLRSSEAVTARHARLTHCPQGHPYSGDNLIMEGTFRRCRTCKLENHRKTRERHGRDEWNRKRREHYARNRDKILAQKRENRAKRRAS